MTPAFLPLGFSLGPGPAHLAQGLFGLILGLFELGFGAGFGQGSEGWRDLHSS